MKLAIALLGLVSASIASASAAPSSILIDSFTGGSSFTLSNSSGTASHNYITGESSIIGGSRQIRVRAAGSGFYGSSNIAINTTAGTLTSFGGDSNERYVQYGSAIGSQTFTGAGTVAPVNLNLDLNLADSLVFDVDAIGSTAGILVTLYSNGLSSAFDASVSVTQTGTYTIPLSNFTGLTESFANDIDGILINFPSGGANAAAGLTVSEVRVQTSAIPEPSSFAALAGLAVLGVASTRRRRA